MDTTGNKVKLPGLEEFATILQEVSGGISLIRTEFTVLNEEKDGHQLDIERVFNEWLKHATPETVGEKVFSGNYQEMIAKREREDKITHL